MEKQSIWQPHQIRSKKRVSDIREAGKRLFIANGYDAVTMKMIANKAAVPIGTIYQFFPSKAALLVSVSQEYIDATDIFHQNLTINNPPNIHTYFAKLLTAMEGYYQEHGALEDVFQKSSDPAVCAILDDVHAKTMAYLQKAIMPYVSITPTLLESYCRLSSEIVKPILIQMVRTPQHKDQLTNVALIVLDALWSPYEKIDEPKNFSKAHSK